MKVTPYFLIIFFCLICASCRTISKIESASSFTHTDSLKYFSHNTTNAASVLSVHDTVRVFDSVRVVVDSIGNVIREFHSHTENNIIRENKHDTVFVVMKDSAIHVAASAQTDKDIKEKIVVKKDYSPMIMLVTLFGIVVFGTWLKRKFYG